MKLLVDRNISFRLLALLGVAFSEIEHVKNLELTDRDDAEIFLFARENGFDAVVTLDSDFYHILQRLNAPPKVIWVRTGNISTGFLARLLQSRQSQIQQFLESPEHDCYEIFR